MCRKGTRLHLFFKVSLTSLSTASFGLASEALPHPPAAQGSQNSPCETRLCPQKFRRLGLPGDIPASSVFQGLAEEKCTSSGRRPRGYGKVLTTAGTAEATTCAALSKHQELWQGLYTLCPLVLTRRGGHQPHLPCVSSDPWRGSGGRSEPHRSLLCGA